MKKKHCFLLLAVLVIAVIVASSRLGANEKNIVYSPDMEEVLNIVAYQIEHGSQNPNDEYRQEAWYCLSNLANTVYIGKVSIVGMTQNGLDFLYNEARAQKVLHPELNDAFSVFLAHVNNHRVQIAASTNDLLDPEMEEVLWIVADGIENSLSDNSVFGDSDGCDALRTEALACLEILAETVHSGDIFTEGLTLDGLNYLYQEVRNQKKLHPELKTAFDKLRVHVNNHRSELEKPETVPQRGGGDEMGDPCYTRDRRD